MATIADIVVNTSRDQNRALALTAIGNSINGDQSWIKPVIIEDPDTQKDDDNAVNEYKGKPYDDCCDCWGFYLCIWCGDNEAANFKSMLCRILCLFLIFNGKDVAMLTLIISDLYDCNNAIDGEQYPNMRLEINEWMMIGSIIRISYMILITFTILLFWECDAFQLFISPGLMSCTCVYIFCIVWTVIGFILQAQMNHDNLENETCKDTVFIWCIIQAIESGIMPICICVCCYYEIKEYDD